MYDGVVIVIERFDPGDLDPDIEAEDWEPVPPVGPVGDPWPVPGAVPCPDFDVVVELLVPQVYTSEKLQGISLNNRISRYGFNEEVLKQKISSLSGGERNILQLAKVSSTKANMLLLDEPTSHLDTYSQMALEKAIQNYNGAILMISHDYHFIVNCMDYVLMIEDKTIRKVSMRKFRKMIYANYFDKDYLEIEQKKKLVETKIERALMDTNFELAKTLSKELEELIKLF